MVEPLGDVLDRAAKLSASGRRRKAVALLRGIASSHPDSAEVWCRLAAALLDRGDATAALAAARRAIPLGGDRAWAHRLASKALSRLGRHEEAVSAARQAVRSAPSDWRCRIALAEAFGAAGSWPDAVDAAAQAVRYQPDHVRPYLILGDAARRTGDLATAEHAYRTAMRRRPGDPRVRAELARLRQATPRSAGLQNFAENEKFVDNQKFVEGEEFAALRDVDPPSVSGGLPFAHRSTRPWTNSSVSSDEWQPRRTAHRSAVDHGFVDHRAADHRAADQRTFDHQAVDHPASYRSAINRLFGSRLAGARPAANDVDGPSALGDRLSDGRPARGRTSAFRRTSAYGRPSGDDRTSDGGRTSPSRRSAVDGSLTVDHSRGDRSPRVDRPAADRSPSRDRFVETGRSHGVGGPSGAGRSPLAEKLAWRAVRQLSMAVVIAGMFLMVAGLPKPTPVLAWLGFAIPCVVVVLAFVELFRVPSGYRFAVLTLPLRRPVVGLACVLLASSNALVLLWAMLDRANAGTMEPLIFALVCAVCAGAVSLVSEA
ncbi:tetratricopeptide repeat protein [Kutzneria sp. 744]|nr:tetratricopeptide repeat protein [Kutzneria sp. 744]